MGANNDISKIRKVFREIKDKYLSKGNLNYEKIVFEVSGGTPQMREALRLLFLLKKNVIFYEVKYEVKDKDKEDGKELVSGDNMNFYNFHIFLEKIKSLIDKPNYNYTGALEFWDVVGEYLKENEKNSGFDFEKIKEAFEYLNYRLNFDFENANKIAKDNEIVKKFNDRLEKIRNENDTIKKLKYLILELLDNMEIELKRGEYANFLARVYRLEEAVGQYLILKWLSDKNCEIHYPPPNKEKKPFRKKPEYLPVMGINRHLVKYFNHLHLKDRNYKNEHEEYLANEINKLIKEGLKIERELNTRSIEEIIKIMYNEDSEERKMLKNIFAMYKYYHNGKGKNLRNNTIIAHGFKGVNREMINEMLAKNGINKDIEKFFTEDIKNKFYKIIDEDVEENIFDKINSKIIEYLNNI